MSLFGANKTTFGATSSTGSAFPFGGTSAATTTTPLLFGGSPASKPLFGAAPQASSTPSLFGSTTTTSAPSTGLFGTTTTSVAPATGLFGSTATPAVPATGLFGSTTTSTAPATGLFGSTTTPTGGGLFGSGTATGGLFSKPATTFGATTSGGLFGAKPAGTGLFGSTTTAQQQGPMRDTLQTIFQNSDALVRSITNPELFGDERDEIVARLNQLAAALGVGAGYFKNDQQPVPYTPEGPFHQLQSISYNRVSEYQDADGMISLTFKTPSTELATNSQKQKLVDALFVVLGSKPGLHAHIETVKALPDNVTEVVVYVTEKGRGRISSKELAQFFNQQPQKTQLETQLKVDGNRIVSRVSMSKQQKETYMKEAPAGIDLVIWEQASRENPDPATLMPVPVRGFDQLRARQKAQLGEIDVQNRVLDMVGQQLEEFEKFSALARAQLESARASHKQLSFRLLRIMAAQLAQARFAQPIDPAEDHMQSALETINARLNAPNQLKAKLSDFFDQLRDEESANREKTVASTQQGLGLSEEDMLQLKRYLARCQDGLESLTKVANSNIRDLNIIASSFA